MTKCRNIKVSNKTFFCRFRGQKFGKIKEMPTLETFLVQNINSIKYKDEWLLCVVVENRALHSEAQSPLI